MSEETFNYKGLSEIDVLFKDSYALFKKTFLQLLVVHLGSLGVIFVGGIVLAVIGLLGALAFGVGNFSSNSLVDSAPAITLFIALLVLFIVFAIVIGLFLQVASILIVGNPNKYSYGQIYSNSLKYIVPMFVVSLLTAIIIIPSFFFFVIPGIAAIVFFVFVNYELVLNNKGILGSVRRSIYVVKTNFAQILLRILILFGLSYLFQFLTNIVSYLGEANAVLAILSALVLIVASFLFGWFITCYSVILYKQAEAAAPSKEGMGKIRYFGFAAIGGVVIIVLLSVLVYNLIRVVGSIPDSVSDSTYSQEDLDRGQIPTLEAF